MVLEEQLRQMTISLLMDNGKMDCHMDISEEFINKMANAGNLNIHMVLL